MSYKTVERLYSDPEVAIALENLHTLMLRRRGLRSTDATGDGTGYALSITQHYASTVGRRREKAKENPPPPEGTGTPPGSDVPTKKVYRFVYAFRLLDLRTRLYVAFGTSLRSERAAYDAALRQLVGSGVEVTRIRLDRLSSTPGDAARFRGAQVYLLPKSNSRLAIQREWLWAMRSFVENTTDFLEQYYQREQSEAGFSADKRMLGWSIAPRREDRIDRAQMCLSTWHNLLNLYGPDHSLPANPSD